MATYKLRALMVVRVFRATTLEGMNNAGLYADGHCLCSIILPAPGHWNMLIPCRLRGRQEAYPQVILNLDDTIGKRGKIPGNILMYVRNTDPKVVLREFLHNLLDPRKVDCLLGHPHFPGESILNTRWR